MAWWDAMLTECDAASRVLCVDPSGSTVRQCLDETVAVDGRIGLVGSISYRCLPI